MIYAVLFYDNFYYRLFLELSASLRAVSDMSIDAE